MFFILISAFSSFLTQLLPHILDRNGAYIICQEVPVIPATVLAPSDPLELALGCSQAVLKASRTEGARLLARARRRATRYRNNAIERGYRLGLERGEAESSHRCDKVVEALSNLYSTTVEKAQQDVSKVAHRIIEELIDERLRESPELLASWITRALALVKKNVEITLRYHPRYQGILNDVTERIPQTIRTSVDATLGEADFAIDTSVGAVTFAWRDLLTNLKPISPGEKRI